MSWVWFHTAELGQTEVSWWKSGKSTLNKLYQIEEKQEEQEDLCL